ncbi:alanine racemase [Thalassotalea euphylliae]|uniref:Alanine racemase n=1 Tax=Thalassotalea euphylliae TaxID=1655234 RepID=A0A3E0TLK7_9GAMM|nr:alanine racemase [Thalassotalea euphylliae]REL25303.1 alanine racemase [Thalassotalea euphylliae]
MSVRTATAAIDLQALAHNVTQIKQLAPDSQILAVLKANAYGHGLERIAEALAEQDVGAFGVARLDEALALRACGVVKPIVLMEGFFSPQELPLLDVNSLHTVIHNQEQLDALLVANLQTPIKVWLKVDTGMHRLGVEPAQFHDFYQALKASPNVQDDIVLMSHLSCADDVKSDHTPTQLGLFTALTEKLASQQRLQKTLANSAAICAWPATHLDWVRPGLMLYGVSPMLDKTAEQLSIQPVMTLKSSLIAKRFIKKGESVGYGAAWTAEKDTHIGVIAIGYGDGYPRHAPNGTPVLINGRRVPLVGRVSMDMINVDLGGAAQGECHDNIGDIATLWGEGLGIEEIAQWATTIPYELLCNITRRVNMTVSS